MAQEPSVLLVDGSIAARLDAKRVLSQAGLTLAGECGFGMEAASLAARLQPDVLLVGVSEPPERPLQLLETLHQVLPETPIIVYSDSNDIELARMAMRSGATDFLVRPIKPKALRFSVVSQLAAREQRQLRRLGQAASAQTGDVITVFGAKGGIGKSTVTTNLAVALALQRRHSVCVIDLDDGFSDVAGMLGVKPERTLCDLVRDLERVPPNAIDLSRYMVRHELSGLDVLPGPDVIEWRTITPEQVRRIIDLAARRYDIVVLDTSAMLNELVQLAVEVATIAICLTTTEPASVNDSLQAMRALEMLQYPHERVHVVMNATNPHDHVEIETVESILQREVFWTIPYDRRLRDATHFGRPVVIGAPRSAAARSLNSLAAAIVAQHRRRPDSAVPRFRRPSSSGGRAATARSGRAVAQEIIRSNRH